MRRSAHAHGAPRPDRRVVDRSVYDQPVPDQSGVTASDTPRRRPDARERLLAAAAELMQRRGYAAAGLAEITSLARAPRGSLYFHFPGGKEQLGADALRVAGAGFAVEMADACQGAPDAASGVHALVSMLSARLQASDYQLGCPIATTALEQAATCAPLRDAAHGAFARWAEVLRERLQADGAEAAVAEERALFALSAVEGALLLARAARSTRPLRIVSRQLAAVLGAPGDAAPR